CRHDNGLRARNGFLQLAKKIKKKRSLRIFPPPFSTLRAARLRRLFFPSSDFQAASALRRKAPPPRPLGPAVPLPQFCGQPAMQVDRLHKFCFVFYFLGDYESAGNPTNASGGSLGAPGALRFP